MLFSSPNRTFNQSLQIPHLIHGGTLDSIVGRTCLRNTPSIVDRLIEDPRHFNIDRPKLRKMSGIITAAIAIAALILGWVTIEIACKPCLDSGREAIDRSLNPDYDPDDSPSLSEPIALIH